MKTLLTLGFAFALSLSAQTQTAPPAAATEKPTVVVQPVTPGLPRPQVTPGATPGTYQVNIPVGQGQGAPLTQLAPTAVVATVDGRKVTAGELQTILKNVPPQVQQKIDSDRKEFMTQYGALMRLVELAKKEKLDQQSPYKEAIDYQTMIILQRAAVEQKSKELAVPAEEVQKFYDANQDRYGQVTFKAIYLPFNTSQASQADPNGKALPTEAEAKAKAEDIVKQARAGADFVKLVKENSGDPTSVAKDGDFPPIRKSDTQIPADIRNALFGAKAGDVTDPIKQPKGFYIFRIQDAGVQPLDQVKDAISADLRQQQVTKWLEDLKKGVEVKMEEAPAPAQAAPVPSASAVPPQK